jgi:hypothetical protein
MVIFINIQHRIAKDGHSSNGTHKMEDTNTCYFSISLREMVCFCFAN